MINIINITIGSILGLIFCVGIFCNVVVKKKYSKMFATMKNTAHDKNLLIIERDYRHGYLKDRVERIKVFVEREYYEIKIAKIPLYAFEDFSISAVYFVALLGLTFTFILISLPNVSVSNQMLQVFFLSVEGLVCGMILMVTRTITGQSELREIFKVNLCNYLEHELELFDEAERYENIKVLQNNEEKIQANQDTEENHFESNKSIDDSTNDLPTSGESESENIEIIFDENALLQVLQEMFG